MFRTKNPTTAVFFASSANLQYGVLDRHQMALVAMLIVQSAAFLPTVHRLNDMSTRRAAFNRVITTMQAGTEAPAMTSEDDDEVVSEVVGVVVPTKIATEPPAKRIHPFGNGEGTRAADGEDLKWLLGGKGANLAEMAALGLPVPPGFTMTTEVCEQYHENGGERLPDNMWAEALEVGLAHVESALDKRLGDESAPLLLSVRSGAAVSMPGMMDTVLNLGLNDAVAEALAEQTKNARFVYDSYRRFLDMFGDVVLGIDHQLFEKALAEMKRARGVESDTELTSEDLKELCAQYKAVYAEAGHAFPESAAEQLRLSVGLF